MARLRRGGGGEGLNAWPGYVDALSTLLMVIIFVLLVFVLAQAFLSVALSGRTQQLDLLNRQITQLSDQLGIEKNQSQTLRDAITQASRDLESTGAARDELARQLAAMQAEQEKAGAERDRLAADLAGAQKRDAEAAQTAAELARARDELAAAKERAEAMRREAEAADRTIKADRETIDAKLSDLARLSQEAASLAALRDRLAGEARESAARAAATATERDALAARLGQAQQSDEGRRTQIETLTQDVARLRDQLATVQAALQTSDTTAKAKDVQIADLGQKLNSALAQRVEELQRYRSEFFGRLRAVLANRPGVQVVGDRFVFQSEVLFPSGGANLDPAGQEQISKLATTLKDLSREIPADVNWVLRVDGHADRQPVDPYGQFVDNWDLSAKRAANVAKLLIAQGVPANRVAATAFADNQPLDPANTPDAYRKNRRIEIRLTDR